LDQFHSVAAADFPRYGEFLGAHATCSAFAMAAPYGPSLAPSDWGNSLRSTNSKWCKPILTGSRSGSCLNQPIGPSMFRRWRSACARSCASPWRLPYEASIGSIARLAGNTKNASVLSRMCRIHRSRPRRAAREEARPRSASRRSATGWPRPKVLQRRHREGQMLLPSAERPLPSSANQPFRATLAPERLGSRSSAQRVSHAPSHSCTAGNVGIESHLRRRRICGRSSPSPGLQGTTTGGRCAL